jgi:hypothetical protein
MKSSRLAPIASRASGCLTAAVSASRRDRTRAPRSAFPDTSRASASSSLVAAASGTPACRRAIISRGRARDSDAGVACELALPQLVRDDGDALRVRADFAGQKPAASSPSRWMALRTSSSSSPR